MRAFESSLNQSTVHQSLKYKNHQSPITKLSNLPDLKNTYQQAKIDNVLNDRSNEVFVPRNASKYIEEPYERKANREKQIEQIRKKYYEQSDHKTNRSTSQRYDRFEMYRDKEIKVEKREENNRQIIESRRQASTANRHADTFMRTVETTPNKSQANNKATLGSNVPSSAYSTQTRQRQRPQFSETKQNTKPFESSEKRNLHTNSHLDRISEASNSNYETVNRTHQTFSPQKNRGKPSTSALDGKSTNRDTKNISAYYYLDSFRNKENYSSVIRDATSVYGDSGKNSTGNGRSSNVNAYQERDNSRSSRQQPKSNQIQSRVQAYNPKPFSIEDSPAIRESSRGYMPRPSSRQAYTKNFGSNYPTIYDNFFSKNATPSTNQKSTQKEQQITSRTRTLTENKRVPIDQIKEIFQPPKMQDPKDHVKRRMVDFGGDDRIKEIQKRLKQREDQFKKKQEAIKNNKTQTQYDRNAKPSDPLKTPQNKQNVEKEIERLSYKIKQFEDKKKELNIPNKTNEIAPPSKTNEITLQSKTSEIIPSDKTSDKALPSKVTERAPSNIVTERVPSSNFIQNNLQKTPQPKDYQDAKKALQEYRQGSRPKSSVQVYQVHDYKIPSTVTPQEISRTPKNNTEDLSYRLKFEQMQRSKEMAKRCDFLQNTKPMYSERTLPVAHPKSKEPSKFGFQLFKIQVDDSDQLSTCRSKVTTMSTNSKQANDCRQQFQMHRRADDGIEKRKKQLQQNKKSGSSQEIKRLVAALSQQAIYDEEFRNCKIWFQNQRDQNKWKELKSMLKDYSSDLIQYTELKDGTIAQFHIYEDENNPFFSVNQESKFTFQALVRSFVACKKHWRQSILNKFDRHALKSEGMSLQKFDLEKKGYINLQDFVRFLNFESGNFYRNRDMILIFKRFLTEKTQRPEKSLMIQRILDVVSC